MVSLWEVVESNEEVWRKANVFPRELKLPKGKDVKAIVGPRRAGKTYYLYQIAQERGKEQEVVFLSFDDILVRNRPIEELWRFFSSLDKGTLLLLDEVQELQQWGLWLRKLHDMERFEIIVSGSSSQLLTREVAFELRGRYTAKLFLPFSFREYVSFKGLPWKEASLLQYIKEGGFPEVVEHYSREKLESIFTTTFYRDLVERHRIREVALAEELLKELLSSTASFVSITRLYNRFRAHMPLSKKTIWRYLRAMEESFALFTSKAHTFSIHKQRVMPFKVYANDTAIASLFKPLPIGHALETVVALDLLRLGKSLFYLPLKKGEVDFVVGDVAIEVSYSRDSDHERKVTLSLGKARKAHLLTLEDGSLLDFLRSPSSYIS